jgi:hypothetical protein
MNTIKKNSFNYADLFGNRISNSVLMTECSYFKNNKKRICFLRYIKYPTGPYKKGFHTPGINGVLLVEDKKINFSYILGYPELRFSNNENRIPNAIFYIDPINEFTNDSMLKIFDHLESIHKNLIFM